MRTNESTGTNSLSSNGRYCCVYRQITFYGSGDSGREQHLELIGSFGKRRIAKAISADDEMAFLEGEINSFLQDLRVLDY